MPQGSTKGLSKKKESSVGSAKRTAGNTKKGKRAVAPKQQDKVRQVQQQKKLSAKINNSIEKQMVHAASAGKLTIMKGVAEVAAGEGKEKEKGKAKGKGKAK